MRQDMKGMNGLMKEMPLESQAYGWATSFFGALTVSEWAVLVGIIVTIIGVVREYFYRKRLLDIEIQKLEIERAKLGLVPMNKKRRC